MKKLVLIALLTIGISQTKAQTWVTIPDTGFITCINHYAPGAMQGNQLDITNPLVTTIHQIIYVSSGLINLTGIQYFTSLDTLIVIHNQITTIPALPNSLMFINCFDNQLTQLPPLPASLNKLNCGRNKLSSLPALPNTLNYLDCDNNKLTGLPALPNVLNYLDCNTNSLSSLPALDTALQNLQCYHNILTNLPF